MIDATLALSAPGRLQTRQGRAASGRGEIRTNSSKSLEAPRLKRSWRSAGLVGLGEAGGFGQAGPKSTKDRGIGPGRAQAKRTKRPARV